MVNLLQVYYDKIQNLIATFKNLIKRAKGLFFGLGLEEPYNIRAIHLTRRIYLRWIYHGNKFTDDEFTAIGLPRIYL